MDVRSPPKARAGPNAGKTEAPLLDPGLEEGALKGVERGQEKRRGHLQTTIWEIIGEPFPDRKVIVA